MSTNSYTREELIEVSTKLMASFVSITPVGPLSTYLPIVENQIPAFVEMARKLLTECNK